MRLAARCALAVGLTAAAASPAWAHGSSVRLGSFFGGVIHPLLEPAHLVALLALGLLIGQRGEDAMRRLLAPLAAALASGLVLAALWPPVQTWPTPVALLVAAALAGAVVAADWMLPRSLPWLATLTVGLGIGLGSPAEGTTTLSRFVMAAGIALGVCAWVTLVATGVAALQRPAARLLVRVTGSWLLACAMLVLALSVFRPAAPPSPRTADAVAPGRR